MANTEEKKPRRLVRLEVAEISLVDKPAVPDAVIALMKADDPAGITFWEKAKRFFAGLCELFVGAKEEDVQALKAWASEPEQTQTSEVKMTIEELASRLDALEATLKTAGEEKAKAAEAEKEAIAKAEEARKAELAPLSAAIEEVKKAVEELTGRLEKVEKAAPGSAAMDVKKTEPKPKSMWAGVV